MPQPGKLWRHGVIGTLGSWLPGDPRGWRSRNHKRHSSGDYQSPPPPDEHAGLYDYSQQQRPDAVIIPDTLRPAVGEAFRESLEQQDFRLLAIAVGGMHTHLLAELPADPGETRSAVGIAKKRSSRAIKHALPGRIWAAGGRFKIIDTPAYQHRVLDYIQRHQAEGAWVWTFRDKNENT